MNLGENVRLAWDGLRANKLRAALTMLGIIIGISSVIAILTAARALTGTVNNTIDSFGKQAVTYYVGAANNAEGVDLSAEDALFSDKEIEALKKQFGKRIASINREMDLGSGKGKGTQKDEANITLRGLEEGGDKLRGGVDMLAGRFINKDDNDHQANNVVISDKAATRAFGDVPPTQIIGKSIRVTYGDDEQDRYKIVGVYKFKPNMLLGIRDEGEETVTDAYIPYFTARDKSDYDQDGISYFVVYAAEDEDPIAFSEESAAWMTKEFLKDNPKAQVKAESLAKSADVLNKMMSGIKIAISFIAGISLLVGGIGVMNIMLVSVTERTREIGVRKALGATNSAIRTQFIVESVIICLAGGFIGFVLGSSLGIIASIAMKNFVLPSVGSVLLSVGFSASIGVFFGYYPANKAAQLDPIEALRYE